MEDIATSNFSFWCPLEINKAIDENTGSEIMRLGGIASTADKDSDGEYLDPKGFDIKPLLESGLVNWHHQAKTNPGTIVGEPSKAEIRKEGLYIETDLYPSSPIARDIWELAQTLEKDSKTRRLGYSIEGKVVKRKSNDKNSPDYKKIEKAIITGVAITHMPKNPKTFAEIIKGEIDDSDTIETEEKLNDKDDIKKEEEEETSTKESKDKKGLSTDSGRALIKEDVDDKLKVQTFGKAEVMERLFYDIPGISIEKAEKIFSLINTITIMSKKKTVTDDDIVKAYEALGLDAPDDITKADDKEEVEVEEEEEVEEEPEDDNETEEEDEVEEEEEDDEPDEKETKKAKIFTRFDRLEKALATSHLGHINYFKAVGALIKDNNQKFEKAMEALNSASSQIEELLEINKAQTDTINELTEQLEAYGNSAPAPKSIRHAAPVERTFKARENDIEKGDTEGAPNRVSIKNRAAIAEILDQATFAKGYDQEFSKACTQFEASKVLPQNIINRIRTEFGIQIVD